MVGVEKESICKNHTKVLQKKLLKLIDYKGVSKYRRIKDL